MFAKNRDEVAYLPDQSDDRLLRLTARKNLIVNVMLLHLQRACYHKSNANCSKSTALCGFVWSPYSLSFVDSNANISLIVIAVDTNVLLAVGGHRIISVGDEMSGGTCYSHMYPLHAWVLLDHMLIPIWRELGNGNNPVLMHENVWFRGEAIMIWVDISINGQTESYVIRNKIITTLRDRDVIFTPIRLFYAATIGNEYICMDDNQSTLQ